MGRGLAVVGNRDRTAPRFHSIPSYGHSLHDRDHFVLLDEIVNFPLLLGVPQHAGIESRNGEKFPDCLIHVTRLVHHLHSCLC